MTIPPSIFDSLFCTYRCVICDLYIYFSKENKSLRCLTACNDPLSMQRKDLSSISSKVCYYIFCDWNFKKILNFYTVNLTHARLGGCTGLKIKTWYKNECWVGVGPESKNWCSSWNSARTRKQHTKNGATRKPMCSKLSAVVATANFQQKSKSCRSLSEI